MKNMKMKHRRNRDGFTIIEILVVVLIISLLAVFVVPKVFSGLGKAKRDIARSKMAILESGLGKFYLDCGRFPDDSEGLEALVEAPSDLEEKWSGPYLKKSEILDPWGNAYEYWEEGEVNVGSYDLVSYGADGASGGEAESEDIYNE